MAAIIVPMYRKILTEFERISFCQLIKILRSFEIIMIVPEGLELPEEIRKEKLKVKYFDRSFFQSVASYNSLMLSQAFYERFLQYEYILIYQLDAFVFSDRLRYFCDLGYDYIGAPWFSGVYNYADRKRKIQYVGNGGLSLRRVKACIGALIHNAELLESYKGQNEDCFFSACDGKNFYVAPKEVALDFSIEREVRECFKANQEMIPFGCHAWERYDLKFWKPYIEQFGYRIDEQKAKDGDEDQKNKEEYLTAKRYTALIEKDELFYGIPKKIKDLFREDIEGKYYLWGAGRRGRWVKTMLFDVGVRIEGFIDTNKEKQGIYLDGTMVYSPEIVKKGCRIIVSIKRTRNDNIEEVLQNLELEYLRDYIFFEDILPKIY